MLRYGLLLGTSLGLVFVSIANAKADLCFRYAKTGGGTLVALGAQLPANNSCQPLALFESGGLIGAANGMICRDGVDNRTIIFHYTYNGCSSDYFESATCRIQLDDRNRTASSSCRGTLSSGTPFIENNDAVIEMCSGNIIPGGGGGQCSGGFSHRTGVQVPPTSGRAARPIQ
jgi:hypothetical protein